MKKSDENIVSEKPKNEISEDISFEESMNKLEKIVSDLENPEISLEESISLYTDGVRLADICKKKISEIESKIKILTKDNENSDESDEYIEKDFN